jgi:hypothetical protein
MVSDVALCALIPTPVVIWTLYVPFAKAVGTVKVAFVEETPLNGVTTVAAPVVGVSVTDVAPVKFVPVMVMLRVVAVDSRVVGVKLLIVGSATIVSEVVDVPVPAALVTEIVPVFAVAGNIAVAVVLLTTTNEVSATVPIFAPVAPVKLEPVIVTETPVTELVGVKLEIVGVGTVNDVDVAVPPGVVTDKAPVFAVAGIVAVI